MGMQSFYSAVDTLYDAIISFCLHAASGIKQSVEVPAFIEELEVFEALSEPEVETEQVSFKSIQDLLRVETLASTDVKNMVMYAGNVSVPVYKNPTIEFDAQIGCIPYGEMVMMLEPKGRFFRISWNAVEGWVLRDELVDRAIRVYPDFVIGQENSVDHANTAHVRTIIGDVFGISRSEFPLQAGEYVLYRLWKKGIRIQWPETRPRVPGVWHKILKGVPNVSIGVTPKVGSIMEYMLDSEVGHLAYVEAIFPDDTLTISEVNYPDSGIYNERELSKEEWKALKPVFLRVS